MSKLKVTHPQPKHGSHVDGSHNSYSDWYSTNINSFRAKKKEDMSPTSSAHFIYMRQFFL